MNDKKKIFDEDLLDDSDLFEKLGEKMRKDKEKMTEIYLDVWEEHLIDVDDEELNENYRNYLKENNIDREWNG